MPLLPDKNGTVLHDCIVPVIYEFTWTSALTETFKRDIPEGTKVKLQSYDCLKVVCLCVCMCVCVCARARASGLRKLILGPMMCLKVDRTGIVAADFGKVISFAPHFDPEVNINPV
jgi:hypothetical protein